VFCSNSVPKDALFLRYSTCKYTVTLKPGLWAIQGHRNRHESIRRLWLPINVPWQPISYRFRDKRRFRSKIAIFSLTMWIQWHYTNVTDGWTDRPGQQQRPHSVARENHYVTIWCWRSSCTNCHVIKSHQMWVSHDHSYLSYDCFDLTRFRLSDIGSRLISSIYLFIYSLRQCTDSTQILCQYFICLNMQTQEKWWKGARHSMSSPTALAACPQPLPVQIVLHYAFSFQRKMPGVFIRHRSDSECQQTASPLTIIGHSIGLLTSGADELFREEGSATYIHTRLVNRSSATLTGPTLWMRNRPAHMRQASALTREKGTCHPV